MAGIETSGPFDIVGDVHGCADELRRLLQLLGWERAQLAIDEPPWSTESWHHPAGRRAVFLGDLVDRGPAVLDTVRMVRNMVATGVALCVRGNHDDKLARWLRGRKVLVQHGLAQSVAEMQTLTEAGRKRVAEFFESLPSHHLLDAGRLVVAHAGLPEELHGLETAAARRFSLYGETTGEHDEFGLPVRGDWAARYRGTAAVVYGHTPVAPPPRWINNTVNIDTGAVFGGALTALRYPEREFVAVPAARQYHVPLRPLPRR